MRWLLDVPLFDLFLGVCLLIFIVIAVGMCVRNLLEVL